MPGLLGRRVSGQQVFGSFPGLNLKVGKMNYSLCNLDPNWATCLKSGQNFPRSGQKKKYSFFSEYSGSRAMLWNIQSVKCMPRCMNMCNKMMEEKEDIKKQYSRIGLKNNMHVWGVEGFCDFEFFCQSGT